ncbi:TonB-dependent receptor [Hyphococcus luteus]|uniref:TonB-dependent receptor n=1 Tax=Hyphococcus luteus TaxID=2058213 RepID=A0A2S7K2V5_9PROT|nr:TonB-dependent receptor [Marinicaulis flavus]PQA86833.1 TonB-dependent receptor [Marinicaulis flavus]
MPARKKTKRQLTTRFLTTTAFLALAAPALAQTPSEETESAEDVVVVTGRRVSNASLAVGVDEASNTVSVTREALLSAPAGVSGLKALEGLPGFNVQTDGALGLYEFGNSVTVRAFDFGQIGFVLDGIPMGRPDPFGGSPIFRYVDNENLQRVTASPGAGDVSLPSATSLGPIVQYFTTDLSDEPSAIVSVTFGDDDLQRTFVKLQTGDINGFSAYVSRSKTDSDLWRGPGTIDREHIEAKAQYEFDDDTLLRANLVYNDFFDYDSPSTSRAGYEAQGRYITYAGTVPDLGAGPDVVFQDSGYTAYYIDRVNVREDLLLGLTFLTDVTENIDFHLTGYWENKDGFGVSPDSYSNTLGYYERQLAAGVETAFGLPLSAPRGVQYGLSEVGGDRYGVTGGFTLSFANHTIDVGGWYEEETYNRTQMRLNKEGGNPAGALIMPYEVAYYRRDYTSDREFLQFYLKDTVSLLDDRLTIEAGFKGLNLDYTLDGYRDFDDYARLVEGVPTIGYGPQVISREFNDNFLPMAGAVYALTDTEQVFASYAQNFAFPRSADDLYDDINTPMVGGERSTNYELGFRSNRPTFNAALALYYVKFKDRIESAGIQVAGQMGAIETVAQNVGAVEAYGVEFTGNWKPEFLNGYAYFTSNVTYNFAEFQDDFLDGSGNPLGLPGNELPDAPHWLVTAGVTVEPTPWMIANVTARRTGERYADFINTQVMESYTVFDAYVDIGDVGGYGPLENIKLRMNVTNFTDEDTLSFTFTTVNGTAFYRPLAPRTFQFSITAEF